MTLAARPSFVQLLVCLPLALLPCCGLPPTIADDAAPGQTTPIADTVSGPAMVECRVVLTPDPVLEPATVRAAALWSAATGCDVEVGEGGVPIVLAAHVWRPDGTDAPGATSPTRDSVRINTRARGAQRNQAVLHEVGHVLGADDLEGDGVMAGGDSIDAAALDSVCARLACSAFIPEAP